jgi:hypothetical protein
MRFRGPQALVRQIGRTFGASRQSSTRPEEEESLRERTSEPLGPEFCTRHREVLGEA